MKRIVVALSIALAGCQTIEPNAGSGKIVLLANPALVSKCRFVKQETVIVRAYEDFGENMERDVQTRMRNAAAAAGGTHVLTSGPQMMGRVNAMQMTGDIYRCQ